MTTKAQLKLSGALTTPIPTHLRGASEYPPIQKQMEHMRIVVEVVISAPTEDKEERKEARSLISGPVILARIAFRGEVGKGAWASWVEENAEKGSVISLTWSPPRQNPRFAKPLSVPQGGRGWSIQRVPNGSSGNNNLTASNGTSVSGQAKLIVGQTHGYPVGAIYNPAVTPILAQQVVTLAATEVAPVIWSGSGLAFGRLTSRRGIDVSLGTMGYRNPKTAWYKRTSRFNRVGKVRVQLPWTHRVAPPRPKISPEPS
ncbi:hypothetical protein L873DRAFT_1841629 [Choiromyces venosus 120613-1]|uniref:Uncharacterized protein n=1 Tax=Choiromyces venosus 120613-1 TaxID=1336337 RepID=A0A3N4K0G1_9PEZI|nr:hypothetical protein L873DRAFT_1841629 [Choiromyces venosus 120613-1]